MVDCTAAPDAGATSCDPCAWFLVHKLCGCLRGDVRICHEQRLSAEERCLQDAMPKQCAVPFSGNELAFEVIGEAVCSGAA